MEDIRRGSDVLLLSQKKRKPKSVPKFRQSLRLLYRLVKYGKRRISFSDSSTSHLGGPLKEGFGKTGIFSFHPELLRGTVNPNLEMADEPMQESEQHFSEIAQILREQFGLSEDRTTSCLLEIKKTVSGGTMGSVIALEFHKHSPQSAPQKKRRGKDSRLDVSEGKVLTQSDYIDAKKALPRQYRPPPAQLLTA